MTFVHSIYLLLPCVCRDFQTIDETLLPPVIEALEPIANISVESQVMHHIHSCAKTYFYSIICIIAILLVIVSERFFFLYVLFFLLDRFCTIHRNPHFLPGMKSWAAMSLV